jgi:RNA polymerase sigma factor (sigma-70 family)
MLSEKEFIVAIKEHEGILHKVCNLYQQDPALRKDLFQEIILNAWKGVGSFRREARFSTWLYRVALNTAISFYRKSKQEPFLTVLPDQLEVASEDFQENDEFRLMYRAIGELSKVDKAVIMLYLEEYSYTEMSELLGISENHIAVKMSRIKLRLKKIISHHQMND